LNNFLVVDICLRKVSTFFSFHVWALCPSGYYLNGLRLSRLRAFLNDIDEGQCCHPKNHLNSYQSCYDQSVADSFGRKGWSLCLQDGYYITGFYKSDCNKIHCIKKFRCCKMMIGSFIHLYCVLNSHYHTTL